MALSKTKSENSNPTDLFSSSSSFTQLSDIQEDLEDPLKIEPNITPEPPYADINLNPKPETPYPINLISICKVPRVGVFLNIGTDIYCVSSIEHPNKLLIKLPPWKIECSRFLPN